MIDLKKLPPNVRIISVREFLEGIPTGGDGPIRRVGSKIIMQLYREEAMDETLREKFMKRIAGNPRFKEAKSGNAYVIVPFHAASVSSEDAAYEQAAEDEQRKRDEIDDA